jgi:hypothetical protein
LNSAEPRRFEVDSCDVNSVDVRFYPYYNVKNFYSRNDTGYAVLPENNPTINLEIVRPDEYAVPFIVEFKNNARKQDTIYIVRRFSFNDIVVQKKGRILFVNNNDARNNKYDFVSYTWRKWDSDGSPIPIDNNTGQYYSEGQDELNANEYFSLELTTKDGKRLSTCKGSVSKARQGGDMTAYPIPAHGTITVENIHWEVDKIVKIYSRSGSLVQNYVAGSSTEVLDVSALQPDAYYLMNDNRSITIVIR